MAVSPLLTSMGLYAAYDPLRYAAQVPTPQMITAAPIGRRGASQATTPGVATSRPITAAPIGRRGPAPAPAATVGTSANVEQQPIHRALAGGQGTTQPLSITGQVSGSAYGYPPAGAPMPQPPTAVPPGFTPGYEVPTGLGATIMPPLDAAGHAPGWDAYWSWLQPRLAANPTPPGVPTATMEDYARGYNLDQTALLSAMRAPAAGRYGR